MKNDAGMDGAEIFGVVTERLSAMGIMGMMDVSSLTVSLQVVPRQMVGEVANDDITYDVEVEVEIARWEQPNEAETRLRRGRRSTRTETMKSVFEWQRSWLT